MTGLEDPTAVALPDGAYVVLVAPNTLAAVPGRPRPERDLAGAAALRVWSLGSTSRLQGGFRWPVPEADLRVHASTWFASDDVDGRTAAVRCAVATAPELTLTVADPERGSRRVLAASATSGYQPYTALLSVPVDAATAALVRRALAGEEGLLTVSYQATVDTALPLVEPAVTNTAARGVAIQPDRTVTATADVALCTRHHREEERPC